VFRRLVAKVAAIVSKASESRVRPVNGITATMGILEGTDAAALAESGSSTTTRNSPRRKWRMGVSETIDRSAPSRLGEEWARKHEYWSQSRSAEPEMM